MRRASAPRCARKLSYPLDRSLSGSNETHPFSLRGKFVANEGLAGLFDHAVADAQVFDFHADCVAGTNLAAEFYFVNRSQEKEGAFLEFFLEAQGCSSGLRHSLNQDDSRHYRILGEVAFEEKVFVGKLAGANTALVVGAYDFVNE